MQTREPFWLSATAGEFAYVIPAKEEEENRGRRGETRGREERGRLLSVGRSCWPEWPDCCWSLLLQFDCWLSSSECCWSDEEEKRRRRMEERKGEKGEKREGGRGRATGVREVERLQGRRRLERGRGAAGRCQRPSLMDREILLLVVHRLTRKGRERRGKRREESQSTDLKLGSEEQKNSYNGGANWWRMLSADGSVPFRVDATRPNHHSE